MSADRGGRPKKAPAHRGGIRDTPENVKGVN